jgi:SAM-dependent methyltransferase
VNESTELTTSAADPAGHYAAKQIFCKDRLIAWSHRRRFAVGLSLARRFSGKRLLDYGCGDGTFLAMLMGGGFAPARAIGAELDDFQVNDCRRRLGGRPNLVFEPISSLDDAAHQGAYDGVVCMEVLEHVVAVDTVIERLWRLLAPDGTLLVSVPVETGLPLLVKQAVRRVAGWRGIGDYPGTSPYTLREYWAGLWAGERQHVMRPVYGTDTAMAFHDHKGFNWMALRRRLSERFVLEQTLASPIPWLGPQLATQMWFVLRRRAGLSAFAEATADRRSLGGGWSDPPN